MSVDSILQYVSPLLPLQTGIAGYSRDLLRAVDGTWRVRVVLEPGSAHQTWSTITTADAPIDSLPTIAHLGNSAYHPRAIALAAASSPILVLHDVVLHQGRLPQLIRRRGGRAYLEMMERRYGHDGRRAAERMLRGRGEVDLVAFPLFEDLVERSRLTIVHSEYARSRVLERVPGAQVLRVPMGVPLPELVPMDSARRALDLPSSAFVIASITHVNPNKRLHVVFRALRRIMERLPEALLVVAGSVSPEIDLSRLARAFGVERQVRLMGYVSDDEARLLARAANVCVNLRYPSAGETSASLLRLLGAAKPVLVTDDPSMGELPPSAVLPVPVDRFEDEMVSELLLLLAGDDQLRQDVGANARAFVEREHSLVSMIDGYRRAVLAGYGIVLPPAGQDALHEDVSTLREMSYRQPALAQYSALDAQIADALARAGIAAHDDTVSRVATVMTRLGLHRYPVSSDEREGGDV